MHCMSQKHLGVHEQVFTCRNTSWKDLEDIPLSTGAGVARELLRAVSAFARPHLVELCWGLATPSRFLWGGGSLERDSQSWTARQQTCGLRVRFTTPGTVATLAQGTDVGCCGHAGLQRNECNAFASMGIALSTIRGRWSRCVQSPRPCAFVGPAGGQHRKLHLNIRAMDAWSDER
jgi:hypothetical protein